MLPQPGTVFCVIRAEGDLGSHYTRVRYEARRERRVSCRRLLRPDRLTRTGRPRALQEAGNVRAA